MRRGAKHGFIAGLWAGLLFLIAEMLAAVAMRAAPMTPFRMLASVIFGPDALTSISLGTAIVVGALVHFGLSGLFGMLYGEVRARAGRDVAWGVDTVRGMTYGAVLWLLNFQVIARLWYPWFLETPQFLQFLLHALFFGIPLGLICRRTAIWLDVLEKRRPI